jgi:hypothetical protein
MARWLTFILCLAMSTLLMAPPTQARSRDEVMVNAFRCSAIADDKSWLQCVYGAAQPLRAQLGLTSATPGQLRLAQSPPTNGTGGGSSTRNIAISAAARCDAIADDRQWLDCYYGAVQPVRTALGLTPAPQASMAQPQIGATISHDALSAPSTRQEGWLPGLLVSEKDQMSAHMTAYQFDSFKHFTVTLKNGEVWRQLPGDGVFAHWRKAPEVYLVTIADGSLGSFNMRVQGEDRFYKVEPVRR